MLNKEQFMLYYTTRIYISYIFLLNSHVIIFTGMEGQGSLDTEIVNCWIFSKICFSKTIHSSHYVAD